MTADIIRYNFKTREKIEKYTHSTWQCSVCYLMYTYDSRVHTEKPVLVQNGNDFYCEDCIDNMKNLVDILRENKTTTEKSHSTES